jgi:hypothetical protein
MMIRLATATLSALLAGLLASCGIGGDVETETTSATGAATGMSMSERLNQDQGYTRDADGNWVPRSDKRSPFESRGAANLQSRNTVNPRKYEPAEFRKTEWTRATSNTPKEYRGDTDGSRFRSESDAQGKTARQSGTRARTSGRYRTGEFATHTSQEDGARRHDRPTDAHTENRRKTFVEPEITDWREQRDMSIEQSRSILAR